MTSRRRVRAAAAALAVVTVAIGACTTGGPDPRLRPIDAERRFSTPIGPTDGHLLGLKWNWRQTGTLAFASEVAGGATFYEVEWCRVEREPGDRDWGRVDEVVATTKSLGYELMLKIRTGSCWATGGGALVGGGGPAAAGGVENARKQPSGLPTDLSAYETFVRDLVSRYAARGVHQYAVENEIDTRNLWGGTADEYAELARTAAAAVRAADPEARVLDAGLSSTAYGVAIAADLLEAGSPEAALRFYADYYRRRQEGGASRFPAVRDVDALREVVGSQAGRRAVAAADVLTALSRDGTFDTYQLHFYEPWWMADAVLDWVRERVPPQTSIEGWEVGLAWPGDTYDEQEHAHELTRLLVTLLGAGVERVVYLPLAYTPGRDKVQVFRGLVDAGGRRLSAAAAYRQLVDATSGATSVTPVDHGGLRGAAFGVASGTRTVLWNDGGDDIVLQPQAGALSIPGAGSSHDGTVVVTSEPLVLDWTLQPHEVVDLLTAPDGG